MEGITYKKQRITVTFTNFGCISIKYGKFINFNTYNEYHLKSCVYGGISGDYSDINPSSNYYRSKLESWYILLKHMDKIIHLINNKPYHRKCYINL